MAKTPDESSALVKAATTSVGRLRSAWLRYQDFHPAVRIVIPSGMALAALAGAWTVLGQDEYGVAVLLAILFVTFGLLALRECRKGVPKTIASVLVVVIGFYSVAVIYKRRGDKPWSSLWSQPLAPVRPEISLPKATPEPTPDLWIVVDQMFAEYNERLKLTEVLLRVEIRNFGAPSAVRAWGIHYSSPTLEKDLRPVRPLLEPMLIPLSRDSNVALEFYYSKDAINEKVASAPVTKEVPITGRLLLNLPGNRSNELSSAAFKITIFDYLGHPSPTCRLRLDEVGDNQLKLLPKESFRLMTKEEHKRHTSN